MDIAVKMENCTFIWGKEPVDKEKKLKESKGAENPNEKAAESEKLIKETSLYNENLKNINFEVNKGERIGIF